MIEPMYRRRAIVWFRQDLRLHDNMALCEALKSADEVVPVYVFDDRVFQGKTKYGFPKTGPHRARFIIESVLDLRESLRKINSDLIVRVGKTEEEIFEIARALKTSWVFCNRERTPLEVHIQDALENNLWSIGQELRYSRGKMLYHTGDLPFPIQHTPDAFTQFRKEVERYVPVREPLPAPEKPLPDLSLRVAPGEIPTRTDLGIPFVEADERAVLSFRGGETAALDRLRYYLWDTHLVSRFKALRDGLTGGDNSTKFSPWLAQGCLSPKQIYHELKKYEAQYGANESTYLVFYELMWRDYHRFMVKKHGEVVFRKGGITGEIDPEWHEDPAVFRRWFEGRTGVPFVDAHMREIKRTGYMSNRGRQNVGNFLINDLNINWQMGADYFESMLIDYDVASNWSNWNLLAGVGADPRETRHVNILSQARRFDPEGEYVKRWIPELADVPADKIHAPGLLSYAEQEAHHVRIGDDYPRSMVPYDE